MPDKSKNCFPLNKKNELTTTQIFGKRLKQLRKQAKLDQKELGAALGVSRGSIGYYENAERTPGIDFLCKTADYFNVSLDYLLGYSSAKLKIDLTGRPTLVPPIDYSGLLDTVDPVLDVLTQIIKLPEFSGFVEVFFPTPDIDKNSDFWYFIAMCRAAELVNRMRGVFNDGELPNYVYSDLCKSTFFVKPQK